MISSDVTLPGAAVAAAVVLGGIAVAISPEIGERLVRNSHSIEMCERGLLRDLEASAKREADAIDVPSIPNVDLGAIAGGLFGGRPGSQAFLDHYGSEFTQLGEAMTAPMRREAERVREATRRNIEAVEAQFRKAAASGASQCECRAAEAVNRAHRALSVFVLTGGWVIWSPLSGTWQAAMSHPEIVAQCKGVT